MQELKTISLTCFSATLLLLLLSAPSLLAASFTADMKESRKDQVQSGKFYMLDHQYRLDVEVDGQLLTILVDRKLGRTRLLIPSDKIYLEIDNDDMLSLSSNPFETQHYMAKKHETRQAGQESIQGLSCDKQIISTQGKDVMTAWIAAKYDFPVKLESQMDHRTLVLEDIRDGDVEKTMFATPTGYKLVNSMPIAPPDWAQDISAAPVLTPPFEKTLQEGQIIRIKPVRDYKIEVTAKSLSGLKGSFSSNAFKDGRPLKRVTGYVGGGRITHKDTPDKADEIVVRDQRGSMKILVELVEAPEGMVLETYDLEANHGRQFSIDHRKTTHLIITDNADDGDVTRGTMTVYKTVEKEFSGGTAYDKEKLREFDLLLTNGETKKWQFEREKGVGNIDITLLEGGARVRVEQPEKPGMVPPAWNTPAAPASMAAVPQAGTSNPPMSKPAPAGKDHPSRMVLIFDASGSMWGQIDGTAKIEIAKQVMTELIDEIPADVQTGLTVYGHRRKGDCSDIEMMVPVGQHDGVAMKAKVEAISPKGKTPIAESLLHVADTLKGRPGHNTIILVTDGIESCDHDPCRVAKALAASGVVTKVHVVGFDLTSEAMDQLQCIPAPSGGLLVGANNAQELKSALNEVVTATLPHNLIVKGLDANDKPLFVSVKVFNDHGQQVAGKASGTLRFSLPAGRYKVEVTDPSLDQTIVLKNLVVEENRLTEKEVVFAQSRLKITSLDGNRKAIYSSASVYAAGNQKKIKHHNGAEHLFVLSPGRYDVQISHGPTKTGQWLRDIELAPGGQVEKEVVFAQSKLKIETVDGNNKALYSSAEVYRAGTDEKIKRKTGSKHTFTLLPGTYDVKVSCSAIKEDKWLRNIVLKGNDQVERQVHFELGKIKITAYGPDGKKLYLGVEVYMAGGKEQIDRATGGSPTFTLKPGVYDIKVKAGEIESEKWLRSITVENGANLNQKVQF